MPSDRTLVTSLTLIPEPFCAGSSITSMLGGPVVFVYVSFNVSLVIAALPADDDLSELASSSGTGRLKSGTLYVFVRSASASLRLSVSEMSTGKDDRSMLALLARLFKSADVNVCSDMDPSDRRVCSDTDPSERRACSDIEPADFSSSHSVSEEKSFLFGTSASWCRAVTEGRSESRSRAMRSAVQVDELRSGSLW